QGRVGAGKNRVGRVPGNFEARRKDCVAQRIQICAWRRSGIRPRLSAVVWRVPSEPAQYADGAGDGGDVRPGVAADSAVLGDAGQKNKSRSLAALGMTTLWWDHRRELGRAINLLSRGESCRQTVGVCRTYLCVSLPYCYLLALASHL